MAKTDLFIPSLGDKFIDLRDSLPGDAYNWSWERSLEAVNYLAIHHTGSTDIETPEGIAMQHINSNGWGGIGYHFLVSNDGFVYYVGDISTARANVANLNEQVIGIGLIGNFNMGSMPAIEQLDSTHKLCEFFINNYPLLLNVKSWDKVRGHKELPNQSTPCPGDNWSSWRIQIVEGIPTQQEGFVFNNPPSGGLNANLQSQVENLQASLASVNQQVINLQELLQERDEEINQLRRVIPNTLSLRDEQPLAGKIDTTLTIVGVFIKLYQFAFPPGKDK